MAMMELIAGGMLRKNTPVQDYTKRYGLYVKREDLCCPKPGPAFSKTRGVYARVASRDELVIGVLDTYHSQAGHAVARACQILGKHCVNYYPHYKADIGIRQPQVSSQELGAELFPLVAGRSCILYHAAKKDCLARGGYMMPNALKLEESVIETAKEVSDKVYDTIIVPASSGTIAAGVMKGFGTGPRYIVHLGYSRSHDEVRQYLFNNSGVRDGIEIVDEGYSYKDKSKPGELPPWPCNEYYDLKAFRWWLKSRNLIDYGGTLFWNIG